MKNKYIKGGDLPVGTIPAYEYGHTILNKKDKCREETAALFDLMFRCSDCFSLTENVHANQIAVQIPDFSPNTALQTALEPHEIRVFSTERWYGWHHKPLRIHVYPCNEETRAILAQYVPHLFIGTEPHRKKMPSLEDLCFYRNDRMTLGSLSHEFMCTVYPPDDDENFEHSLSYTGKISKTTVTHVYTLPKK